METLPESLRFNFLVSLLEARREILIGLNAGILPLRDAGLDVDEFEFLLVVDAVNRESVSSVTIQRLQQELGVSAATVQRRLRSLRQNDAWLQDSNTTSEVRFSSNGFSSWTPLMDCLSKISSTWFSRIETRQSSETLIILTVILAELRKMMHRQNFSRSESSFLGSIVSKPFLFNKNESEPIFLEILIVILRLGRLLEFICNSLANRYSLNLHEADILVILALHLSEGVKECRKTGLASEMENELGWDSFFELNRYLVFSQGIHPSVFSRAIKRLGAGSGNLGLIEVATWVGRSKKTRVSEKGFLCAEQLWKEYLKLAGDLLDGVSDELILNAKLVVQEISTGATTSSKVGYHPDASSGEVSGRETKTHPDQPQVPTVFEGSSHNVQCKNNLYTLTHLGHLPHDKKPEGDDSLLTNEAQDGNSGRSKSSSFLYQRSFRYLNRVADWMPRKPEQGTQLKVLQLQSLQKEISDLKHLVFDRDCEISMMRREILSLKEDFRDFRKKLPNSFGSDSLMGSKQSSWLRSEEQIGQASSALVSDQRRAVRRAASSR